MNPRWLALPTALTTKILTKTVTVWLTNTIYRVLSIGMVPVVRLSHYISSWEVMLLKVSMLTLVSRMGRKQHWRELK